MKLIKLNGQHYIAVDDFDIYKEDFVYYKSVNNSLNPPKNGIYKVEKITNKIIQFYNNEGLVDVSSCKKVTHSTQPLESIYNAEAHEVEEGSFRKIKPFSLSEVEEAINGYSVEKMANSHCEEQNRLSNPHDHNSFIEGFNAHKELVKDKLFTVEQLYTAFSCGRTYEKSNRQGVGQSELVDYIKSLEKTEWDVEFDEQGKIVLL